MISSIYNNGPIYKITVIKRKAKIELEIVYQLFIRIRIGNKVTELSTGIDIKSKNEFDAVKRLPIDKAKRKLLQLKLEEIEGVAYQLERANLLKHPKQIIESLKQGIVKEFDLCALFQNFIEHQKNEVFTGNLTKGTLKNYFTTQSYLKQFVKHKYKCSDVPITMFDRSFIDDFNYWLALNTRCGNNGRYKHFERLKRFVKVMTDYDKINHNPFRGFKLKKTDVRRVYLTEDEMESIRCLELLNTSLKITRDMFLLMCNTGLSFSDLDKLSDDKISFVNDVKVIKGYREKTKQEFLIPLSHEAIKIIEKYQNCPQAKKRRKYLPVFSNQVFNRHLKLIAEKAKVDKPLSSHVGRHSFSTSALTKGVPAVSIQRVLGHADLRMTQRYARLIDSKLIEDMRVFTDSNAEVSSDASTNKDKIIPISPENKGNGYMRIVK